MNRPRPIFQLFGVYSIFTSTSVSISISVCSNFLESAAGVGSSREDWGSQQPLITEVTEVVFSSHRSRLQFFSQPLPSLFQSPVPPDVPLLRAFWSLSEGSWGVSRRGSCGVLAVFLSFLQGPIWRNQEYPENHSRDPHMV